MRLPSARALSAVDHMAQASISLECGMDVALNSRIGPDTVTWLLQGEALCHRLLAIEQFNLPLRLNLMPPDGGGARRCTRRPARLSPGAGLGQTSAFLAGGVCVTGQPAEPGCPAHLFAGRRKVAAIPGSATLELPSAGAASGAPAIVGPCGNRPAPSNRHPSR